jgi:hypothetical protein
MALVPSAAEAVSRLASLPAPPCPAIAAGVSLLVCWDGGSGHARHLAGRDRRRRRRSRRVRSWCGPRRLPLGQPRLDSAEARTKTVPDETADAGDGRDRQGDSIASRAPMSLDDYAERMRMAAIMLAQLDASQTASRPRFSPWVVAAKQAFPSQASRRWRCRRFVGCSASSKADVDEIEIHNREADEAAWKRKDEMARSRRRSSVLQDGPCRPRFSPWVVAAKQAFPSQASRRWRCRRLPGGGRSCLEAQG